MFTTLSGRRARTTLAATVMTGGALLLAACSSSSSSSGSPVSSAAGSSSSAAGASASSALAAAENFTMLLPWYADPEGGGFFAAQEEGLYAKAGLNVTLQSGGPQVSETTLVATGRAQIGFTDAAGIVEAEQQGIPIIAIGALYQNNPVGVMVHSSTGITNFKQMGGKTWVVQTGELGPAWVEKQDKITFQTQAYEGSIAAFLKRPDLVQQGWATNEAYQAQEAGVKVSFIPFSASGFNPYNDVFFTSKSFLATHKAELEKFLAASMQGWQDYMGNITAAKAANAALLKANNQQTSKSVWFAWDKERPFVTWGDGKTQLGAMTAARWSSFLDQLVALGQIKSKPPLSSLYDASLLPKIPAPASFPPAPAGSY
jgi:NitT/TauT family transport system substrate-binding protein